MKLPETRSPRAARGLLSAVLIGVASAAAATLARAALDPLLELRAPYITYFLAVVLASWLGSTLAGVISLVLGALAAEYFFVPPRYVLSFTSVESSVGLLAFLAVTSGLMAIVHRWRRTEAALLRAQAVLGQAGEMAHLGAWSIEYTNQEDLNANPLYWSDETYRIFGYRPHGVAVSNDLFFAHLHPGDRPRVVEAVKQAVANRRAYSLEHRIIRADGVERTVHEHAEIEFDAAGRPRRMVGAVQDVTDQRRIERTVREASERLRRIVEHIHDALIMDDVRGRVVFANDRFLELFGFEREDLPRLSLEDYVAPEHRQLLRDRHDRRIRGEAVPSRFEYEGLARDGRRMWLEVDVVPVYDDAGAVIGTQSALRDVTERKRAADALRASEETARRRAEELEKVTDQLTEANRLKDEFIATVSHELRTPLNAMLGWAELLRDRKLAGPAEERALHVIANNARRQAQLIEDLLDMSRIVAGKLRLEPALIDPYLPIHAAIEAVLPSAEAKGIKVCLPPPAPAVLVFADAARLQQIVWNLLTNAVKFTPQGGSIFVEVRLGGEAVEIVVRDTGTGIPAHFLPHVFDRFRQADSRTTRAHGGLGIGLSIVRHLVEAHGGEVRAESEGENRGATFVVTLPLKTTSDRRQGAGLRWKTPAAVTPSAALRPELTGVRVLAVDDEPDARELTRAVLRHYGAEVMTADSAGAALEALGRDVPDVLLIDIAMPGTDGFGLLRLIRERGGGHERVPAIALTAYAREEDRNRALANGFQAHLAKPVEEEELARTVADLARKAG